MATTVLKVQHDDGRPAICPFHQDAVLFELGDDRKSGQPAWRGCMICLFEDFGPIHWDKSVVVSYETGDRRSA